jgi:DNA-binding NarL/FixJ family response regulator
MIVRKGARERSEKDLPMIRIFIADDHAIVRHGLRQLIDAQGDMRVVGEASDGRQVLLAEGKEQWDILLLDLSLPRVNGIEVLRRLRSELPKLRVVALSMYPEDQYAVRLLEAGAAAYLSKEHPPEQLLAALRKVACGGTFVSGAISEQLRRGERRKSAWPHDSLSAREYQIFTLLLAGRTVSEVAAELNLSASTVSSHLAHVKEKLGVRNVAEIIDYGHRAGLVPSV